MLAVIRDISERKRAEAALRNSESKYRGLFANMRQGVFYQSADGKLVDVNPAALEMFGLTREEFLGRTSWNPQWAVIDEHGLPVPADRHPSMVALATGEPVKDKVLAVYNPRRGEHVWLVVNAIPEFEQGSPTPCGVFLTMHDITRSRQTEKALRESEERFREIAERIESVFWITNPDSSQVLYVSPAYEQVWRRTCASLYEQPSSFLESIHPEDRERATARLAGERAGSQGSFEFEYRILWPDGTVRWIRDRGFKIVDSEGRLLRILGLADDITERRRAEEALQFREEISSSIVSQAADAIVLIDASTSRLVEFNAAAHEGLGYTREEFAKLTIADVEAGHSLEQIREHVERIRLEGGITLESMHRRRDGGLRDVRVSARALRIHGRDYVAALWTDTTDHKRSERELERRNSLLRIQQETSLDGILVVDEAFRVLSCNRRFVEMWGLPAGTVESTSNEPILESAADQVRDQRAFLERIQHLYAHRSETSRDEVALADGRIFDRYSAPVAGAGGEYYGRIWYFRDMTESKRAERALRESETKWRETFENSRDPMGVTVGGMVSFANAALLRMFGYSQPDELAGRRAVDLVAPVSRSMFAENMVSRAAGLPGTDFLQVRGLRKDGSEFDAEVSSSRYEANGIAYVHSIVRDVTKRKQAEDALRDSETKWRVMFEHSRDAMAISEGGIHMLANPALLRLFGYSRPEEVVGRPFLELIAPSSRADFGENAQARADGSLVPNFMGIRCLRKDGSEFDAEVSVSTYQVNGAGYTQAIIRDITGRKRAEQELLASRKRLEDIIFSMGDWVWETDENSVYTYSSQKGFDLFGAEPGSVIGKTPYDLMPPEEARRVASIFSGIASRKEPVRDLENWSIGKNGELICLLTNGVPVLDEAGNLKGYRGVDEDITARKRAEQDYARLAAAIQQAAETVMITDSSGNIVYANPAFERTSGYTVAEVLGTNPRFLKSGTHDTAFYTQIWDVLGRGDVWRGRLQNKRKNGTLYLEEATISPVRDEKGRIANYIAVKLDVTKEAELQAQLLQSQKMESVGRLAGGIAHDFNNLLTVINGYSNLALAGLAEVDPLRHHLEEIGKAGERAAGLTRQLLAFSRKQVLKPQVLDLNRVVMDMHSMLRRLVGEEIEVNLALVGGTPMVSADPSQLQQVIFNLTVNARDAMPGGGRISIETSLEDRDESYAESHPGLPAGRYVSLSVSDTGVGMDEATLERIFEPFFTTKATGKGTGLGLSVTQGIVLQSGGHIDVQSAVGSGSTFRIYLPALAGAPLAEVKPAEARSLRGKETILVAEDQDFVREFAVAALRNHGYRVLTASDGKEALEICERKDTRIDLLLTDVVMPRLSGPELVLRLKTIRPGIRAMFMSGYTAEAIARHGVLEQGTYLIQKPFSSNELAGRVRAVLGPPRAVRILIADDEAGVRSFLRAVLEQGGHEVSEAADGKQALHLARATPMDLVITDLVMPEAEGLETIQALRRAYPDMGIIAISGAFGGRFLETAGLLGADAVLRKPVDAKALLDKVEEVLKRRGGARIMRDS